jgi:hypothetical protein
MAQPLIELVDADRRVTRFERGSRGLRPKQTFDVDEAFFVPFAR